MERFRLLSRDAVLPRLTHLLAGADFRGAQLILVEVIAVDGLRGEGRVTVALPASAQVQLVIDTCDAETSAQHQTQGIVLPVARVGNLYLAQQGRVESPGSSQSVDAQCVVAPVGRRPLLVVDEPWGKRLQLEVRHAVAADDHGCLLLVKLIHDALQRGRTAVEVIAVQLHGKASATEIMHRQVPAPTYAQVVALRDEMHQAFVLLCQPFQHLRGAIRTAVVDDDDVEAEIRLLCQGTAHGILDGLDPVPYRDDDTRLYAIPVLVVHPHHVHLRRSQVGIDLAQVARGYPFHLNLPAAVARIHVVKLLLPAAPHVRLHLRIEILVDVYGQLLAREEESQVVECGMLVVVVAQVLDVLMQVRRADEQQRTHPEVITYAAQLVVDERHALQRTVGRGDVMVGITQRSPAVLGNGEPAFQGMVAQPQRPRLGVDERIGSLGRFPDVPDGLRVEGHLLQMMDAIYQRFLLQQGNRFPGLFFADKRYVAVNSWPHL